MVIDTRNLLVTPSQKSTDRQSLVIIPWIPLNTGFKGKGRRVRPKTKYRSYKFTTLFTQKFKVIFHLISSQLYAREFTVFWLHTFY